MGRMRAVCCWLCIGAVWLMCLGAKGEETIQYDPAQLDQPGTFYRLEQLGIQLFMPESWEALPVSEEMAERHVYAFFLDEEGVQSLVVTYGEMITDARGEPVASLASLERLFQSAGYDNARQAQLNGLPCVIYSSEAEDILGAYFLTEGGRQLAVHITPMAGKKYYALAQGLLSSVMGADTP